MSGAECGELFISFYNAKAVKYIDKVEFRVVAGLI